MSDPTIERVTMTIDLDDGSQQTLTFNRCAHVDFATEWTDLRLGWDDDSPTKRVLDAVAITLCGHGCGAIDSACPDHAPLP